MNLSLFLTKRYIRSPKESRSFSVFSFIAVLGIMVGVATLIIALSVLNGFEEIVEEKLIGFDSHLQIIGHGGRPLGGYVDAAVVAEETIGEQIDYIDPYIAQLSIIGKKKRKEGVTLKGVMPSYFEHRDGIILNDKDENILRDKPGESIIIGRTLAERLFVATGDTVVVFAIDKHAIPSAENPPRIEQFIVASFFESGLYEYDNSYAFIDIDRAREIFSMPGSVSGYEIKLNTIANVDSLAEALQDNLGYPHYVQSIFDTNLSRQISTWIDLQKKLIPIVLLLIIVVAVFNIVSTLLMLVIEKTNAIGTLKAMGASRSVIIKVFMFRGMYLSMIGILLGNIAALLLSYAQLHYNIIKIPASVYFVTKVPLVLEWQTFLIVSCVTALLCFLTSLLPSYIAAKVSPLKAIRFT